MLQFLWSQISVVMNSKIKHKEVERKIEQEREKIEVLVI